MDPDGLAARVRAHVAAWSARDIDTLLAGLDEAVVWQDGGRPVRGTARVRELLHASLRAATPGREVVTLLFGPGDRVAAEMHEVHVVWGNRRLEPIVGLFTMGADGRFTAVTVFRAG